MVIEYSSIDAEVAEGHLWRARELLSARVATANYDAELFRRYAAVLHAMGDQDEAGRFYMLAGERAGTEGLLADQFLQRRALPLPELWAAMPEAARRISPESVLQPLTAVLLQAGYGQNEAAALLSGLIIQNAARETHSFTLSIPHSLSSEATGVVLTIAAAVVFLLGIVKLCEVVASLLGY